MGNLGKFKTTVDKLIKTDEEAKLAKLESTGQTEPFQKFSTSEDKAILSYISDNQEWSKVGGSQLWKKMEEIGVVRGRSWQSIQRRFQRRIIKNICSYDFLSKEQIDLFREKEKGEFIQDEDQAILSYITRNQVYSQVDGESMWREMERQRVVQGRTWETMRRRFQTYILENIQLYDLTDEQISFFKENKGGNRKRYTKTEDRAILNYIVSNQMYSKAKGWGLWKKMEDVAVVEGRNFNSMRSRFYGHIIKNLNCYGLTDEQVSQFEEKREVAAGQETEEMEEGEHFHGEEEIEEENSENNDEEDVDHNDNPHLEEDYSEDEEEDVQQNAYINFNFDL